MKPVASSDEIKLHVAITSLDNDLQLNFPISSQKAVEYFRYNNDKIVKCFNLTKELFFKLYGPKPTTEICWTQDNGINMYTRYTYQAFETFEKQFSNFVAEIPGKYIEHYVWQPHYSLDEVKRDYFSGQKFFNGNAYRIASIAIIDAIRWISSLINRGCTYETGNKVDNPYGTKRLYLTGFLKTDEEKRASREDTYFYEVERNGPGAIFAMIFDPLLCFEQLVDEYVFDAQLEPSGMRVELPAYLIPKRVLEFVHESEDSGLVLIRSNDAISEFTN